MQPAIVVDIHHTALQPTSVEYWETALTLGFPAALWRLPYQRDKHLIVSFDTVLPRVAVDLEELPAGFALSPFDNLNSDTETPAKTLFLRADIHARFSETGHLIAEKHDSQTSKFDQQITDFQRFLTQKNGATSPTVLPALTVLPDPDVQAQFERDVAEAIDALQRGEFRKVVLSRVKQVQFADVPNAVLLFDRLCEAYPTAFISAVSVPERGQIWISATPERLVSQDADGIFKTLSLAGTQSARHPDGTAKRAADALWSQKEIEEQALVSRYIIECFKKIRLREYLEEGPKTVVAGNLMHLGSHFTVDTQAVRYPQLGTVMLRLLHPTSAVCGMPRDRAFAFIEQHETYDREFYAGFLGPINIDAADSRPASHLFVHIRCMKLEGRTATLYAGAGLTEDSDPTREWLETEMKCQTLLSVISYQPTANS
ncbi:chorismate-binding protein [Spirosoma montaniterrae]|uniref:isochorismate synthase n=1 Tax=Spirosoma montaniterrae TaxID=1178516 RepID=A0A1P9WTI4_9BACT|nr:chorismate-binding protein [Spirosoma montaniterrae]AQG78687.1 chloride transporter [Spirosoma montaniterrae]